MSVHDIEDNITICQETTKEGTTKLYATTEIHGKDYYTGGTGDDQNGIFLALELLKKLDTLKVIFTIEEEQSAVGARNIDQTFLADIGYYIEGDRKGSSDIITEDFYKSMVSDTFKEIVLEVGYHFNYKFSDGLFTDICYLYEMNEASAINISVGYYNAHSHKEYTIYEELLNAVDFVEALILALDKTKYKVDTSKNNKYYQGGYDSSYDFYDDFYNDYPNDHILDKKIKKVKEFEEFEDANSTNPCINHEDEIFQDIIDINCITCNPIISKKSSLYCGCAQELTKRKYTFYCLVCNTHKINKYEY